MATTDDIIRVKNELLELSNITRKLAKTSIDDLSILMTSYDKLFNTSKDNLEKLLESSDKLRQTHAELNQKIIDGGNAIKSVNDELKKQREDALIDENTQLEIIKDMQKQKKILNELAILNNKLNDTTVALNQDEIDKIKDRIILLDNENKIITKIYASKKDGHLNEYRYAMELSTTHSDTLDKLDNINTLQEKASINAKEYANESERAAKALEKQNKMVAAVVDGAKALWSYAVKVQEGWADFNDLATKSGRAIGMNHDQIENYQRSFMRNTKALADKYGVNEKSIIGFQNEYINSTARAIVLTRNQTEAMTAMSKLAGDNTTNQVAGELDNFGVSIEGAMVNLGLTQERAMKYGLSASKSGDLFAKNIKLASQYTFKSGIDGVSKMTLLSQKLKFNLESLTTAADNFSTIEGAIGTSAKLQMLGGSYAGQFGNPMTVMYEAMNDFESFAERITDTYGSKGVFNKKTGEVEIGSMDKRFIKESAAALGMSYTEAMNIAMSKVKINEIEGQIQKGADFTESNKVAISNLATWDADKMGHVINYTDENGQEAKVQVKDLDKKTLDYIQRQTISEDAMQKDVRDIARVITQRFGDRSKTTVSWREGLEGLSTTAKAMKSEGADSAMNSLNDTRSEIVAGEGELNKRYKQLKELSTTFLIAGAVATTSLAAYRTYTGQSLTKMLSDRTARGLVNRVGGASSGSGRMSSVGRFFKKGLNGAVGLGKKIGKSKSGKIAGIGAALAALGLIVSSNSSSNEGQDTIKGKENSNIVSGGDTILDELTKQTRLLEIISGIKTKDYYTSTKNESSNESSGIGSTVATIGANYGLRKMSSSAGKQALLKAGGRKGLGMAVGAGKMLRASNPFMMGGLALDAVNFGGQMTGMWDEGSTTDKTMSIGSSAATGAGIGAMIGSIATPIGSGIGAAIGGAIGGIVGIVENYGDDIKEWAIGKDNLTTQDKVQTQYEETKFGATSISDPQLGEKAALATVKIHDILISIWHNMNGKQSNGLVKDDGFFGGTSDFLSNIFTAPSKIGMGIAKSTINAFSTPQDISPMANSMNISPMIDRPSVRSIASVGVGNDLSPISMYSNNGGGVGYQQNIKIPDINLNVNGTMKLVVDSKSVDIDIKKLLDNPQFKETLIKMVKDGLDKNQGLGKINRNNITSQRTSSGYKS